MVDSKLLHVLSSDLFLAEPLPDVASALPLPPLHAFVAELLLELYFLLQFSQQTLCFVESR
jgi:hypothetical protein